MEPIPDENTHHAFGVWRGCSRRCAAVGAATAALLGTRADERIDRTYQALARAFITMPSCQEPPGGQRPGLTLVKSGPHN